MDPTNGNTHATLEEAVEASQIFGAKTLTLNNSKPEVLTTGRFERHTGACKVHVSV
jgi:hypothetical protein